MKPHVICHMVASIDGRILHSRWRPQSAGAGAGDVFEQIHARLDGDAWLVGRVTGQEFAKGHAYTHHSPHSASHDAWFSRRDADAYGVVLDAQGRIAWGRADIGGDPIVVVLTEQVSDAHLAGLRQDGVSYFFAGQHHIDLPQMLETLQRELGVKRLLVEGGGAANGACLRAGMIDEISLVIMPAVDGAQGAPSVFDSLNAEPGASAPVTQMTLTSCETLDGGAVWLRYQVKNQPVSGPP